jgi:AcrR family transcriptional regulator
VIILNNTKRAIFDSAIKIFSINGYNGATMDDIAQNAGVAKGTLYYHFKSKEEIFNFIIEEGMKTIKQQTFGQIEKEEDPVNKLRIFCKTQLNLVNEYKDFLKVIMSQLWGDNLRQLELRNAIFEYAKELEGYVKQAIKSELIKDDDTFLLSCSLLGSVCSLAIHDMINSDKVLKGNANKNNDKDTEKLLEYLLDGIGVKEK